MMVLIVTWIYSGDDTEKLNTSCDTNKWIWALVLKIYYDAMLWDVDLVHGSLRGGLGFIFDKGVVWMLGINKIMFRLVNKSV